jgi:hypothetical protein
VLNCKYLRISRGRILSLLSSLLLLLELLLHEGLVVLLRGFGWKGFLFLRFLAYNNFKKFTQSSMAFIAPKLLATAAHHCTARCQLLTRPDTLPTTSSSAPSFSLRYPHTELHFDKIEIKPIFFDRKLLVIVHCDLEWGLTNYFFLWR